MNTEVPVICITGGPCAGKTTILTRLQQRLSDMGFHVVIVAEAATNLILSGVTPKILPVFDFQEMIFRETLRVEDNRIEAACRIQASGKKVVVLTDRGIADIQAYTSVPDFERILAAQQQTLGTARDGRYDAVIFLHSVAHDAPDIYTLENNLARRETVEQAIETNRLTLEAWTGHPHLKVIGNEERSIDVKTDKTLASLCRILGIPVPIEIEEKYLLDGFNIADLPQGHQAVSITQYYLRPENPDDEERIRSRANSGGTMYYHTIKRPHGSHGVRIEIEKRITRTEFADLLKRTDTDIGYVTKTRHCFVYMNQYFELDVFSEPQGLILLEVELTEENDKITLPPFLADQAVNVTDQKKFSNKNIARGATLRRQNRLGLAA